MKQPHPCVCERMVIQRNQKSMFCKYCQWELVNRRPHTTSWNYKEWEKTAPWK